MSSHQYEAPTHLPEQEDLHVLAVLNRFSSNYPKAQRQFEKLQALGFAAATDHIETAATHHDTMGVLGDKLTAGQADYHAVVSLTGDGGSNTVGQSLYHSRDERMEIMPVVFGKGGGACDLHAMTQGTSKTYLHDLPGQMIRQIQPVDITARSRDGETVRRETAFAHVCMGLLGQIALDVNGEAHRGSKFLGKRVAHEIREFMTAAGSLRRSNRYMLGNPANYDEQLVSDVIVTLGNQMGRQSLFPGDIFEPNYHQMVAPNLGSLISGAARLKFKNRKIMQQRTESDFSVTPLYTSRTIVVQYDGETFGLPLSDAASSSQKPTTTDISFHTAERPLYVATPL